MDEIDGMNNGDKGGITALIKLIRQKKTKKQRLEHFTMNPVICIGNYYIDKKIKELMKVCNTYELKPPTQEQIQNIIYTKIPNFSKFDISVHKKIIDYIQGDLRKIEFIEKRISKIDSKKLDFIIIDDDYKSQDIWNHLLKKCQIKFYFEPDTFFEDIILGKININKYDVIISDYIFKSDNTSTILTADKIKISYKLKEKYKYNGLLLLSSSLSENEFNNNKDLSYFDKNIENKFLSYKKIRELYLRKKAKNE
jgi:hypothetical protein